MESFKSSVMYSLFLSFVSMSSAVDMITPSQHIQDGKNETLVSTNGTFEAGFFSPENSKSRYVGIWYKVSPITVVWVANRETPLNDYSGVLGLDSDQGILSIMDGTGAKIWSSNASKTAKKPIVVQLLESGNLVVKNGHNLEGILWQSFDYPSDTLLPGMKIGSNLKTGQYWALKSWKSLEDPTPGDYSFHIDTHGLPQIVITKEGTVVYRSGSWNGLSITGTPDLITDKNFKYLFVTNREEVFYEIELLNSSVIMRSRLTPFGYQIRFTWSYQKQSWDQQQPGPFDQCTNYALCGTNTNCNASNTQPCECLTGFKAKSTDSAGKFGGCVRTTPLDCNKGDSFYTYEGMKLPDTSSSWYDKTITLKECERLCLSNCSCTGYAKLNVSGMVSGCLHWFSDVVDMRKLPLGGQDFYLRVTAPSQIDHRVNKKKLVGIVVGCTVFIIGITVFGVILCIRKKKLTQQETINRMDKSQKGDIDLPMFDFLTISNATNQFSHINKLGQGGFGPVYKGILSDGQEIAVKRLSKSSGQGLEEFKNEVMLIAKLQHRNLVKLLGCSIQQEEKLLIYEFMPNRSLDYFIFDSTRRKVLGWAKRLEIVGGIARGLLYLHEDSRLKIIHRDLKTSNVLLDSNMNPKISDFGMARTFELDQDEANTNRVMGTYGYMPPEYAVHGSFSVKSDVFSFGVIVLEIISGRKNRGFSDPHRHLNLLGHAWRLWIEERPIELMDELVEDSTGSSDILRYIHIGLLCVQQIPEDRPNMSSVVLMLNGEKLLPEPSQPGFYTGRDHPTQTDSSSRNCEEYSRNEISDSLLEAR
ncbi:G-type lectin S-receptor-like serine/threonine-protein kinase At4g27290 [Gastrolobium bilobum]|uniref:G-type lectin S-receptor-like serine/threonine-protein kinase At4g27290 n=1 Tax=Gastrolobium bilobum TaxID=150636 RepID=UPI002AAFAFC7|nr:G-type lectin S-receptor-like serine/threonine-protein kinase At4g27290 [Gastrolobium bilobum]